MIIYTSTLILIIKINSALSYNNIAYIVQFLQVIIPNGEHVQFG